MLPAARTITGFDMLSEDDRQVLLKAVQNNHTELRGSKRPRHRGPYVAPVLPLSQVETPAQVPPPPEELPAGSHTAGDRATPFPVQDGDAVMAPASPAVTEPPGIESGGGSSPVQDVNPSSTPAGGDETGPMEHGHRDIQPTDEQHESDVET